MPRARGRPPPHHLKMCLCAYPFVTQPYGAARRQNFRAHAYPFVTQPYGAARRQNFRAHALGPCEMRLEEGTTWRGFGLPFLNPPWASLRNPAAMSFRGLGPPDEAVRRQFAKRTRTTRLVGPHSGMTKDYTGRFYTGKRQGKSPGCARECPFEFSCGTYLPT